MDCIVHGVEKSNFHFHFSLAVKNPPPVQVHAKEKGPILGLGRSPEGGHGDRLHYSCLENPMDTEVWWATIHRDAESDTMEVTSHARTKSSSHKKRKYIGIKEKLILPFIPTSQWSTAL